MHLIAYMANIPLRTPTDIGAMVRARRRVAGLDQAELAALAGVSRLWINQVEKGKPGASLGLVLRTLAALGIKLTAFEPDTSDFPATEPLFTPDINEIIARAREKPRP